MIEIKTEYVFYKLNTPCVVSTIYKQTNKQKTLYWFPKFTSTTANVYICVNAYKFICTTTGSNNVNWYEI